MEKGKTLAVIGGGAAVFFCAVNAARMNPGLKVILVEKTTKLLSKVKVSGGGRCNVTHACFDITEMSRKYPRGGNFVKKAFYQFFTTDTIEWFRERQVELKQEKDGRMFPVSDSSQTIIDCLLNESSTYKIDIRMNAEVKNIDRKESRFQLSFAAGKTMEADFVCVASGGYPKSSMFEWLQSLGHNIEQPIPSLFTFNMPGHSICQLMGVSVEHVKVKIAGSKLEQEGPLLITHWGLSGPAILKLSAWAAKELAEKGYEFNILINWVPDYTEQSLAGKIQSIRFELAAQKISSRNPFGLPNRLWEYLLTSLEIDKEKRWTDLPAKEAYKLVRHLCVYELKVKGKTTFKEEFVTAGGIKLTEIDHNTMMSKKIPHLFFAGEVMDVDGITGGFNFQHAWTSGFIAAKAIAESTGDTTP
jgi:predicted Rossmann fold flavoprotein